MATAVTQVGSLAGEFPHPADVAKKKKKSSIFLEDKIRSCVKILKGLESRRVIWISIICLINCIIEEVADDKSHERNQTNRSSLTFYACEYHLYHYQENI